MELTNVFQLANTAVLPAWLWLCIWLFLPSHWQRATHLIGLIVPLLQCMLYAVLILVYFSDAEGGFTSLQDVMLLFDDPGATLAGWVHFLAFDLLIGWLIARHAINNQTPVFLVVPCLFLTFMFGPTGLLLYIAIRIALNFSDRKVGEAKSTPESLLPTLSI